MKVKSLALVLAIVLLVGTAAPVLAKNPFADVPADHWAYDAIVQLAAAGLVEGYPDGTYGGARMMTRYEAAMVFARTLARLESLVADEVAQTNAGLRDDVTADVLADIEAAKAELVALIKDELANLDIPVEERIIEKVVVEQPIEVAQTDDAILQRLRDLEIGQEALEGDMSYVENRVLGLVDGLRYDLDSLKDQPFELTPEAEEVIADLVAEKVKEEIAAAELGAKEVVRTVVEKVVVDEDAVTEDQVVMIAEELLAKNLRDYDVLLNKALRDNREQDKRLAALEDGLTEEIEKTMLAVYDLNAEFGDELALLGIRVDDLEKVFIALEDRVTTLEKDQAALKAEVDRVKFGGTLKFEGENKDDAYTWAQNADLNLTVKASDSVTVNAFLGAKSGSDNDFTVNNYGVEVTSDTPITRLVVGSLNKDQVRGRFNSYVLKNNDLGFGGLADFTLVGDLKGNAVVGKDGDKAAGALGLEYAFIPELGLKAAVSGDKAAAANKPDVKAVSAGLFGEIVGIKYDGTFAMDLTGTDENMLFGGKLSGDLGPVGLSAEYVMAQDNFGTDAGTMSSRPFVLDSGASKIQLGADVDFLGIAVDGGYYREMDAENEATINAYKFGAKAEFEVFVPFEVSGQYAFNDTIEADEKKHSQIKFAVGDLELFDTGLSVGASFAMIKNELKDGAWKDSAKYLGSDVNILAGNIGYETDFRGAALGLGYDVEFKMPQEDEAINSLAHTVSANYGFTDDVKLSLTAKLNQKLDSVVVNTPEYKAGLEFKF